MKTYNFWSISLQYYTVFYLFLIWIDIALFYNKNSHLIIINFQIEKLNEFHIHKATSLSDTYLITQSLLIIIAKDLNCVYKKFEPKSKILRSQNNLYAAIPEENLYDRYWRIRKIKKFLSRKSRFKKKILINNY
ncbi:unnamed protein product [Blepharisma stoltei]|uniref:Uncharacterized protein n=1 Tax=Blepharisma stoltei TaxID=1481888 RepID=A0AAU9K8Y5_9CILI|nr:unnamed protein product [Blepharisma stoltei]